MTIRSIAQEVYKCQSRVHSLEDQLRQAAGLEKERIKEKLRKAQAELKLVKNMLENRKDKPPATPRRFPF